ncbi:hypothetical protein LCGC14_0204510 [marine sediment metagenome]|uniref:Uncharacterized protein n=1 Tax=marine sediment metagenome TaxID=412755 RepID=A0A0F9XKT4_9ZZZZ
MQAGPEADPLAAGLGDEGHVTVACAGVLDVVPDVVDGLVPCVLPAPLADIRKGPIIPEAIPAGAKRVEAWLKG